MDGRTLRGVRGGDPSEQHCFAGCARGGVWLARDETGRLDPGACAGDGGRGAHGGGESGGVRPAQRELPDLSEPAFSRRASGDLTPSGTRAADLHAGGGFCAGGVFPAGAAGVFSVCQIGLVALWPVWWGGYCWGPRLLTEILAPLMILVAAGLPALSGGAWRRAVTVVAVYGLLIQAIGVYCYPEGRWDRLPVSVDRHPERLWDWRDNPIARTVRGGAAREPYEVVEAAVGGG